MRNQPSSPNSPGFAELKAALIGRLEALLQELAPGGRIANGYYKAKNPTRADNSAGSFWVRTTGAAIGAWRDEATGDDGDLIQLIGYCLGLQSYGEIYKWCLDYLGLKQTDPATRKALVERRKRLELELQERKKQEEKDAAINAKKAKGVWLYSREKWLDTPLDDYFNSRSISIRNLKTFPQALRYRPTSQHTDDETGEITDWPTMYAAMQNAEGNIVAVHRTWLRPDGSGKAPVSPPRRIWPRFEGCVIRLAKGERCLSPEEAGRRGVKAPVVITEGIEDGLAVYQACPDLRIWAAGTLGNIGKVPILPCISKIIVCADNDAGNPQAKIQLQKSIARLQQSGLPVAVVRSFHGKDMNDLLQLKRFEI
jgi:hypothetical protein